MPSWNELLELFQRSHTWKLLQSYATQFSSSAPQKLPFLTLAQAQEEFQHLLEVFEQDLRLSPPTTISSYVTKTSPELILKATLTLLISTESIGAKALLLNEQHQQLAQQWSSSNNNSS